jgi:hypothetical protein
VTIASPELLLVLAAALFYLYDSSIVVYGNEGLLSSGGRKIWKISFQPNGLFLFGRVLVCPNPLFAHRPIFRLYWLSNSVDLVDDVDWVSEMKQYGALTPLVYSSAVSIFVVLPSVLYLSPSIGYLLLTAGCIYLSSIVTATVVVRRSKTLGLSRVQAWSLAAECVMCPPIAINVIRRLSLAQRSGSSLPAAGLKMLSEEDWQQLKTRLLRQLDLDLELTQSDMDRQVLTVQRHKLATSKRPS